MVGLTNYEQANASEKSWGFASPSGGASDFYIGGFYDFAASNNDFNPAATHGTANASYAAHFFVVLGETAVDEITITVTGTSINDLGTRATSDTQTITIPNTTGADTYFETSKKWIGQVSVETTAGTAKNCNYGFCKYWDNNNNNYSLRGLEVTWLGGANDATIDITLRHHKATGWTYNAGSTPTPPTEIASMNASHVTEIQARTDEEGAWKLDNLTTTIAGAGSEGIMWDIHTSTASAFRIGNLMLRII